MVQLCWRLSGYDQNYRKGMSIGCADGTTEEADKKTRTSPCIARVDNQLGLHNLVNAQEPINDKKIL